MVDWGYRNTQGDTKMTKRTPEELKRDYDAGVIPKSAYDHFMAGQHTQGEIYVREQDDDSTTIEIESDDVGGVIIRVINPYEYAFSHENPEVVSDFQPQVEANATRIVKCWNMHEKLVKALKQARAHIEKAPITVFSGIDAIIAEAEAQS